MILLALVLGLMFQVLVQPHWFSHVTRLWLNYCEVFGTWYWFSKRTPVFQMFLITLPVLILGMVLWALVSDWFWGLGGLALMWGGLVISSDGYRFAHLLAQWEASRPSGSIAPDFNKPNIQTKSLILTQLDAPKWEKIDAASPLYYDRVFGHHGDLDPDAEAEPAVLTALVAQALFLFVPIFWFVWFGPLGSVLICLAQATAASEDLPISLRSTVSDVLKVVSWLPVRLYAMTLFVLLRDRPIAFGSWWSAVKSRELGVELVLLNTFRLLATPSTEAQKPAPLSSQKRWFFPVCHKVLWIWVGAVAFFTLIL